MGVGQTLLDMPDLRRVFVLVTVLALGLLLLVCLFQELQVTHSCKVEDFESGGEVVVLFFFLLLITLFLILLYSRLC